MKDARSLANAALRSLANALPVSDKLRTRASNLWTRVLDATGEFVTVEINDQTWQLRNQFRTFGKSYEPEAFRLWSRLIQPGDTVWDVGANIGFYTLMAAQSVGPQGSVLAWEPTPDTFSILKDHVRANVLTADCRLINEAISDIDGELAINIQSDASSNRIGGKQTSLGSVIVAVHTLDFWANKETRLPQVIKMDIEGAEVLAFKGMQYLLSNSRPMMLVAIHPQFTSDYGMSPVTITQKLKQFNYVSFNSSGSESPPENYSEYLLLPEERSSEIQDFFG